MSECGFVCPIPSGSVTVLIVLLIAPTVLGILGCVGAIKGLNYLGTMKGL